MNDALLMASPGVQAVLHVMREGPTTRQAIQARTGYTYIWVSQVVKQLIRDGLAEQCGIQKTHGNKGANAVVRLKPA